MPTSSLAYVAYLAAQLLRSLLIQADEIKGLAVLDVLSLALKSGIGTVLALKVSACGPTMIEMMGRVLVCSTWPIEEARTPF